MSEVDTPVAAYAKATATLKKFISELDISNDEMKKVINGFDVDMKPLDVSTFADDVLGILSKLIDETKYPNAKIAIEQITAIKKALAPLDSADASAVVAPAAAEGASASAADHTVVDTDSVSVEGVSGDNVSAPLAKGDAAAPLADDAPLDSAAAPLASAAAAAKTATLKPPVVLSDGTVKYDRGDGTFLYKNDSTYVGPDDFKNGGKRRQSRTRNRNRNRNRSKSAHGSKRR